MKKIILAGAMSVLAISLNVNAADAVAADEGEAVSCPFDSVYFGLGIGGSFWKNKAENVILDADAANAQKDFLDGNKDANRFIGTVVIGGGKALKGKFYVGAECLVDFTSSKNKDINLNKDIANVGRKGEKFGSLKNRGIVPALGLRFGYVVNNNWLVYVKPSLLFPKTTYKFKDTEGKENEIGSLSKAAFSVALGLEKAFCKKFSARLEGEYVFRNNKTFEYKFKDAANADRKLAFKGKTDGWNIRAICAYNVKY
ncbi:MAG: hypothetical protein LBL99_02015 [Holosporaceae bacterium]|jgi:opacity protein-like surface antigen|nr:hypothetical protein [Holosporaceae bacterium]